MNIESPNCCSTPGTEAVETIAPVVAKKGRRFR
jgi:hypothetical protein